MSIRDCTAATSPLTRLGGQHGEESKEGEEDGEEENREEAEVEEVGANAVSTRSPSKSSKAASQKSARSLRGKRKATAKDRADSSRRQRASAKPRFTLHGHWLSGPTYKVGLMLSLGGVPFSYVHIDLRAGEQKSPDYLAKNRYGQVPCLAVGEIHLCQSAAILDYLADALGTFAGRNDQERARVREWLFWGFDQLAPGIYRTRAIKRGFRPGGSEALQMYEAEAKSGLKVLDDALAKSPFLVGKRPTAADVDAYGVVHFAADGGLDLAAYPNVRAWMARVENLEGFGTPDQILPKVSRP